MRVGICGFPGSGKTTIFSALSPGAGHGKSGVTYGNIKVPDPRVDKLAEIFNPKKKTYAEITFMDVGGQGGRVGGAFPPEVLQAMRNADVLVHVVRAFDSPMHSEPANPARDVAAFNDELILLDLSILEKRRERWKKEARKGPEVHMNDLCVEHLENGNPLRTMHATEEALDTLAGIQLLSIVPLITLYNIGEDDVGASPWPKPGEEAALALCGELEAEIAAMPEEDQAEFLEGLGLGEPARNEFVRTVYSALHLISFLTAGPDECRAWTIEQGTVARKAAGKIHSDLERGFIRAEVYRLEELIEHGTEAELKKHGLVRAEGKDYVVVDGDVMNIRFNV